MRMSVWDRSSGFCCAGDVIKVPDFGKAPGLCRNKDLYVLGLYFCLLQQRLVHEPTGPGPLGCIMFISQCKGWILRYIYVLLGGKAALFYHTD